MNVEKKDDFLRTFIKKNHSLVMEYHRCHYNRHKVAAWKEQLRVQFVGALDAGGIGRITEKAASIEEFVSKIQNMKTYTYEELKRVFDAKSYDALFSALANKKFKQMAKKKAALFLRDILYLHDITIQPIEVRDFKVPVDKVIKRIMDSIYPSGNYMENASFESINQKAKKIFPNEPILLDDLWFWGHFYRCKEEGESKVDRMPLCSFNCALLTVDIDVTKKYRDKLNKFADKNPKCPLQTICGNEERQILR